MSNGVASLGTSSGSLTKTNSASGSMNLLISQAELVRSTCGPERVAHFTPPPPQGTAPAPRSPPVQARSRPAGRSLAGGFVAAGGEVRRGFASGGRARLSAPSRPPRSARDTQRRSPPACVRRRRAPASASRALRATPMLRRPPARPRLPATPAARGYGRRRAARPGRPRAARLRASAGGAKARFVDSRAPGGAGTRGGPSGSAPCDQGTEDATVVALLICGLGLAADALLPC